MSNDLLFKSTTDCLNSIKDVKFYNVENYFNNIFTKSQRNFLDLTAKNIIFSTLPRYIVEIVAFGTIFITLFICNIMRWVCLNIVPQLHYLF